ncbi:hypothetical protein K1719_042085 [Acacia pycnantha]|nr:hypothetical protein K1719_042085 [Acacia pycnantha]
MKITVRNCWGAASKGVVAVIRDMKKRYRIDVMVILEPRISGGQANKVIRSWGFEHSYKVEAEGFSGVNDEQFIHCKLGLGREHMVFTAIYANPNEHRRSRIWPLLKGIADVMEEPWILIGDFNEIKSPLEQKGGGRINEARCNKFNTWIQECRLIDIDANGPFFTWRGPKWEGLDRVFRRLDRCLCNTQWQERFMSAEVQIIPRLCSDHHPILVNLSGERRRTSERGFKFEAMWQLHDQFGEVLANSWKNSVNAQGNLLCL